MNHLTNRELVNMYIKATELGLAPIFLSEIKSEIKKRGISIDKITNLEENGINIWNSSNNQ